MVSFGPDNSRQPTAVTRPVSFELTERWESRDPTGVRQLSPVRRP
jgi:hypothetical protein